MKKRIILPLALFLVATSFVTCGNETSKVAGAQSNSEYHVAKDIDLFKFSCDVSESETIVYIEASGETVTCQYDSDLDDWAWIPKK
ncbi:MAG: hypothetical protein J5615_05515 [Fibrobacter sp.]|nr:hypothetical protein [Fibrobacter sp.]